MRIQKPWEGEAAPYHLSLRAEAVPGERTAHTKLLPCRPCTSSPLQSDSVMTISGAAPTLCLLDKSKFEHFVVVDRTFVLKLANSDSLKL